MKIRIYEAIIAALILVLICSFVGCGTKEPEEEQEVPEINNIVLLSEDSALSFGDYRIVRANNSGAVIKGAALILQNKVRKLGGPGSMSTVTDSETVSGKEILLGNTNRLSDDTLLLGRFKIVRDGNNIAILGGSDQAVIDGVNYFVENCIGENGILCGEGYVCYGGAEYGVTSIKVNGKILKTFNIKNELDRSEYADRIADEIEENVGIPATTVDGDSANFVITDNLSLFELKDGQWALAMKEDVVYLIANNEHTQKAAFDYFVELLNETHGSLKFQAGIYKQGKIETKAEFYERKQLVIYPELPAQIKRNYDYKVSVTQGKETHTLPVYDHTMEYDPIDCGIGGDFHRRFSQFAFSGERVRVDVKVGFDFGSYSVIPSAKGFESSFDATTGTISVYLDKPDYFGIRLDNDDNTILSVFADLPEFPLETPSKDDENVIYIEGWYEPEHGFMDVRNPYTTLYIAPGAVLCARVKVFSTATASKVLGRGVILDPYGDIYNYDIRNGGTEGHGRCLCSVAAKDSLFDGPILMDARCFNLATSSTGVTVRNYKALSTMMTTDGITASSGGSVYEHCWIYCGDNALVISWSNNQVYRDISIGTTCSAIFPQGTTNNIELDGIYVFRANGGIINNWYNNGIEVTSSVTIRNIDCIDANTFTRFFGGRNMGCAKKTFNFINVNLPTIRGDQNLHKSNGSYYANRLIHMENPVKLFTENYTLNFTNLYINGKAIKKASKEYIVNNWNNEFNFSNDETYEPVKRHLERVRYRTDSKVYVGELQVMFAGDVLIDGDKFLLPADEIVTAVRTSGAGNTVDKDGKTYISSSELRYLDSVESAEIRNGNLYITLKSPECNLLLPDDSRVSQIAESTCYTVDLVTEKDEDGYIYTCYSHADAPIGGISVMITDELRMYGTGKYTITFKAKASNRASVRYGWTMDDQVSYSTSYDTTVIDETAWISLEVIINVNQKMLAEGELFTFRIMGVSTGQMEYFSIRDLVLTKN